MSNGDRRSGRVLVPLIVVLVMAALIFMSVRNWQRNQHAGEDLLVVSGTVEARFTRIASLPGGRLSELHVQEGQSIAQGDAVALTDPFDLPQRLEQSSQAIAEASAMQNLLLAGPPREDIEAAQHRAEALHEAVSNLEQGSRPEEIAAAESEVEIAASQLNDAQDEVRRLELLFDSGVLEERRVVAARAIVGQREDALAVRQSRLEQLRNGPRDEELEQARQLAAAAVSDLERLQRGARPEEIQAGEARVAQLMAARDVLERNLEESAVLSPAAGEIVSVPVTVGDLLSPGQTICELLLPDSIYIQTFVPENRLSWISIGSSLEYAVDGLSGRQSAIVSFISPVAEFTPRNLQTTEKRIQQVFRIKLTPSTGVSLRPGEICDIWIPAPEASDGAVD